MAQPQPLLETFALLARSPAARCANRPFTSNSRLLKNLIETNHVKKAKAPSKVPKKVPSTTRSPVADAARNAASRPAPEYQSYASKLAQSSSPTLLYLAPSHTLFISTAYAGALFCLGYAGVNYIMITYYPPEDLSRWIPYAYTGVCFLVSCLGGYLGMAPLNVIKSIRAIPSVVQKAAPVAQTAAIKAATEAVASRAGKAAVAQKAAEPIKEGAKTIHLELELRRLIPFLPAPKVMVKPEQCTLSMALYHPVHSLPPAQRKIMEQRLESLKQKERDAEKKKSILLAPFRHASQAGFKLMKATQRIWTREGFLELKVGQKAYKLDISGGWALDEGRALDRLIKSTKAPWQN